MEILTFNEFPTLRVIESEWYDESDKQLSFTYRDENFEVDDGLRTFIAMKGSACVNQPKNNKKSSYFL